MELTQQMKDVIEKSVLCWLASSSMDHEPNVSPKEIFCHYQNENILVANIASPGTVKNIKANSKVCISVLDIFVQKGFQFHGNAEIIDKDDEVFERQKEPLYRLAGERFPFSTLTNIRVERAKEILAPSYLLYPDSTSEEEQIESAKQRYLYFDA